MSANATLRAERLMLIGRYDCYSFSPAIFAVMRDLEIEISWIEHKFWARRAVAPLPHPADRQTGITSRAR